MTLRYASAKDPRWDCESMFFRESSYVAPVLFYLASSFQASVPCWTARMAPKYSQSQGDPEAVLRVGYLAKVPREFRVSPA